MVSLDRQRRIKIVRSMTIALVGLVIAYLLPEILGLILKIQSGDTENRPWVIAMGNMPIRIVHIIGLVVTGVAAIGLYRNWALRFIERREGEN